VVATHILQEYFIQHIKKKKAAQNHQNIKIKERITLVIMENY
jgi:hypothetical protein